MRTQGPDRTLQGDKGRSSEPRPSASIEGSEAEEADKSGPQRSPRPPEREECLACRQWQPLEAL